MFARGGSDCPVQTLRTFFSGASILKTIFSLIIAVKGLFPHHKWLMSGTWLILASNSSFVNSCRISSKILVVPENTQHIVSAAQQHKRQIMRGLKSAISFTWVAIETKLLWDPSTGTVQQHKNSIWVMHLLRSLKRPLRRSHCPVL